MTESTGALAEALAKVQAELPKLERDRTVTVQQKNGGEYSYSYVTLANLSDAVLPLLARNGLAFAAMPGSGEDGKMCLRYALMHTSGDRLEGEFPISGEGGIQMVGGRITYTRRYVLAALVGVAADEDDESRLSEGGSGTAQRAPRRAPAAKTAEPAPKTAARASSAAAPPPLPGESDADGMTKAQQGKVHALFGELGVTERQERLDYVGVAVGREVASSSDLTKQEAKVLIDRLTADTATTDVTEAELALLRGDTDE